MFGEQIIESTENKVFGSPTKAKASSMVHSFTRNISKNGKFNKAHNLAYYIYTRADTLFVGMACSVALFRIVELSKSC